LKPNATENIRGSGGGFSLLELVVTMALLIVIFVMLYSSGSKSYQRKQMKACAQNLQNIFVALQIYANEHDGAFPVAVGAKTSEEPLTLLVPQYTSRTSSFICPGSKDSPLPEGEPFGQRRISYAYYMGRQASETSAVLMSDEQINDLPKTSATTVFSVSGDGPGSNHNKYGGNFLFCDGAVKASGPVEQHSIQQESGIVLLNPRP